MGGARTEGGIGGAMTPSPFSVLLTPPFSMGAYLSSTSPVITPGTATGTLQIAVPPAKVLKARNREPSVVSNTPFDTVLRLSLLSLLLIRPCPPLWSP